MENKSEQSVEDFLSNLNRGEKSQAELRAARGPENPGSTLPYYNEDGTEADYRQDPAEMRSELLRSILAGEIDPGSEENARVPYLQEVLDTNPLAALGMGASEDERHIITTRRIAAGDTSLAGYYFGPNEDREPKGTIQEELTEKHGDLGDRFMTIGDSARNAGVAGHEAMHRAFGNNMDLRRSNKYIQQPDDGMDKWENFMLTQISPEARRYLMSKYNKNDPAVTGEIDPEDIARFIEMQQDAFVKLDTETQDRIRARKPHYDPADDFGLEQITPQQEAEEEESFLDMIARLFSPSKK